MGYRHSKDRSTDGSARASSADNAKDAERRIPLASITAIALESELYLEFSVDSTIRGKKFLFRCSSRADLQMWLNGLADLSPTSDHRFEFPGHGGCMNVHTSCCVTDSPPGRSRECSLNRAV